MAQDFFVSPITSDWFLESGTTIRLCETTEELTRQRLAITLRTFKGEWFGNTAFGVPYFESIWGKNNKEATDAVFRRTILSVEGVLSIIRFESEIDPTTREYSAVFSVNGESGPIEDIEI